MGGFDLYRSRILFHELQPPENMGAPVNSCLDDMDPTLVLEGHGLVFSSNRAQSLDGPFYTLYQSVSREVLVRKDYSDLGALFRIFDKLKWPLLILLLALLALLWLLRYLLRQNQGLHSTLLQRCLLASILFHILLAILTSTWVVSSSLYDMMGEETGELCLNMDALAEDRLCLEIRENVTDVKSIEDPSPVLEEQADTILAAALLDPLDPMDSDSEPTNLSKEYAPAFTIQRVQSPETPTLEDRFAHLESLNELTSFEIASQLESFDSQAQATPEPQKLQDALTAMKFETDWRHVPLSTQPENLEMLETAPPSSIVTKPEKIQPRSVKEDTLADARVSNLLPDYQAPESLKEKTLEKPAAKKQEESRNLALESQPLNMKPKEQTAKEIPNPLLAPASPADFQDHDQDAEHNASLLAKAEPLEQAVSKTLSEENLPKHKPHEQPMDATPQSRTSIVMEKNKNRKAQEDPSLKDPIADSSNPTKNTDPTINLKKSRPEASHKNPAETKLEEVVFEPTPLDVKTPTERSAPAPDRSKPKLEIVKLNLPTPQDTRSLQPQQSMETFKNREEKKRLEPELTFSLSNDPIKKRPIPLARRQDAPVLHNPIMDRLEEQDNPIPLMELAPLNEKTLDQSIARYAHDKPRTYHGLDMQSKKVVFCLDVSSSMEWNNRIKDARQELLRLLDTLDESIRFNIITFSGRVRVWNRNGLQMGTHENIQSAKSFVKRARIGQDGTNTVGALSRAFDNEQVESIYFLSDGHPTAGFTTDSDSILRFVQQRQKGRNVSINTIAYIKGLPPRQYRSQTPPKEVLISLMRRLAEENSGNHVVFDSIKDSDEVY